MRCLTRMIVGGTGRFAGATGRVVTSGTNIEVLAGGVQAVQSKPDHPPLVWYFVSIDGDFEMTVELS